MEWEWTDYDGGAVQEWHRSASHIRVSSDVTVIPAFAFADCGNLRAVDLSNVTTISADAFNSCRLLERVIWTTASAVEIGECAFRRCDSLGEIDLRNVTQIGRGSFLDCCALKRVTIPLSVATIADYAFYGCNSLVEVGLGDGIQRIGEEAFCGCSALSRLNIPPSVTVIGKQAFYECSGLTEVTLNEGLQRIGHGAFISCSSLVRITISSTTLQVGRNAFALCYQLRDVELREGLQAIGADAFRYCGSLERITIPASVTSIGNMAFENCNNLSEVTLREGMGLHDIEEGAFYGCTALEHINIPPVAFVIDMYRRSYRLSRGTMPVNPNKTLIASKWMQYRSPNQLEQAEAKVNEILGRNDMSPIEKTDFIRKWFAYYERLDVTTMLELAIWRANNGTGQGGRTRQAVRRARQAVRRKCGRDMNIIIPGVVEYLEG